ncbi:MAG: B12-binding domain-containing radical SAM protein [Endomicrobiales bacterium]|nr:B12-binding domain-containing radical SAM protein [Endomicrobiales bacterium]
MKNDVLLINPPWIIESKSNFWKNIGSCLPSLGIAYIASCLEKHGYAVSILDCTAEKLGLFAIEKRLFDIQSFPAFIGITSTTPLITHALKVAEICKKISPKTTIIFGGVHPTVLPDDVLSNACVDIVVRGEGEMTMLELVSGKAIETILGVSYKKDGRIVHNAERPLIADINEIPPPAYHLLPMKKYFPAVGSYRQLPAMSIFATRGCPGRCTFCYRTFQGKVRKRSPENIFNEIKLLHREYGIMEIAFYDDAFTAFHDTVTGLCDQLIKSKLNISWSCFTRVDLINEDMMRIMKKAGCHLILFGVESADPTILKNIRKNIDLAKVIEMVKKARRVGINTRASFMLGNPGENEETIRKTIDFAFKLDPDQVHFNITTAYPGTELFCWAKDNGYLSDLDWSKYNMSELNLNLPTISQERLQYYYNIVHKNFYMRPRIILRRLLQIRTYHQFMEEIKGFFGILKVHHNKS